MPAQPEDRKKKANEPIRFTFDKIQYTIDPENADNLELLEFIEDEKYISAIRGYLGADQWAKFKEANRADGRVSSERFEPFLNAAMKAISGAKDDVPN
jgi:hypothetical protein